MRRVSMWVSTVLALCGSLPGIGQTQALPTGTLPISEAVVDGANKLVGHFDVDWVWTRLNGNLTTLPTRTDPSNPRNLIWRHATGIFFTTADCSGPVYLPISGPVEGGRPAAVHKTADARFYWYVAADPPYGPVTIQSTIQDPDHPECRNTDGTYVMAPAQAPLPLDTLFTLPLALDEAPPKTTKKTIKLLPDFTSVVDSANRFVGRHETFLTYTTINGLLTAIPTRGSPDNPEKIVVADGFGLYFPSVDCTGPAYVLNREGTYGVQPASTYKAADGRWALYIAASSVTTPIHYRSQTNRAGECGTGEGDELAAPVYAPIWLDTLFTEPFSLR